MFMNNYYKIKVAAIAATCLICMSVVSGCGSKESTTPNPSEYIELGQYKGLTIAKSFYEVSEEDVQAELDALAGAYATSEKITEGKVETGDIANIDYEGKKDGVAFEGGTAKGYDLTIGSGTFIPGFEDGLIGVEVGKTVDLPLTFPENYGHKELAGADVIFTVTVNYITRSKLPEITDDFIIDISEGQYANLAEYRVALEEQMKSEYDEFYELQYYEDLLNQAVDNATVIKEFPDDYLREKTERMLVNARQYAVSYNLPFDQFLSEYMGLTQDEFNEQAIEYAGKAAKESMVVLAIAEAEGLTVTEEDIAKAIQEYIDLGTYASEEEFRSAGESKMEDLKEYILTSKVEDILAKNAVTAE